MNLQEAITARHSVRSYTDEPLSQKEKDALLEAIHAANKESGLHIQLICDEPKAFSGAMAHYGKFSGVKNYIACIGKKTPHLDEDCGYFGEKLVLLCQQLGLNTCWVGLTYSKVPEVLEVGGDEKVRIVISVGHGATQGVEHKNKPVEKLTTLRGGGEMPDWFKRGIQAAQMAPTAMNQQAFHFTLEENGSDVHATPGIGFFSKVDLGIAKLHFEIGAGQDAFNWA